MTNLAKAFTVVDKRRTSREPIRKLRGRFLATSSMSWLERAGRLPGRSLHVAIAIKHQLDLARASQAKLQAKVVRRFGVDRHAERRALAHLETAELIKVSRFRGRRPVVTMLDEEIDTRV